VWLTVVESKFPLLNGGCSDVAKVRFSTQQLRGPAQTWWDHFLAMQPVDHVVEWGEFKAAFRGHHIPAGIMDRKLNEFLALTQGGRTVLQYAQAFNDLCQYAGYHADTDEEKRDRFRRGLSTKLCDCLNTVRANSYNELVNMAISQEDCITARQAEKKRKTPLVGPSAQAQRFRIVSDTQSRGPQQQGRWVIRPQQQQQAPARSQKRKATSPTPQEDDLDQEIRNMEMLHQQVQRKKEKMARLADLQRQIDEASEEVRHLTQDEQNWRPQYRELHQEGFVNEDDWYEDFHHGNFAFDDASPLSA
jgi:hypothetical protein